MTREEAINEIKSWDFLKGKEIEAIQTLIPELAESEDERIIKTLIDALKTSKSVGELKFILPEPTRKDCIAYLEKQKEPVVNKEGMYYYLGGKFIYCDYPAIEGNPYDFAMNQQEKQKEQKEETLRDFIDDFPYSDEQKEQKPDTRDADDLQLLGFIYDLLNEIEWKDDWAMSKEECLRRLKFLPINLKKKNEDVAKLCSNEWSEEDQKIYDEIMSELEKSLNANRCYFTSDDVVFLKSFPFKLKKESEGWRHYIWATNLRFDFTALIKYDNTDNYEIVQAGNRPKQEKNGIYILIKDIESQPSWKPSAQELGALKTAVSVLTEERTFPNAAEQIQKIIDVFDGKELRKDWKPTEEQMNGLAHAINLDVYDAKRYGLDSLYNDLKKLM